ncbi:MAG TPA: hypothetical protein VLA31_06435 [Burkholderiaceae bacterium]|jgi:hypothetical protein|nr:hypothetical protein [Burkholderiaceae bacterium]
MAWGVALEFDESEFTKRWNRGDEIVAMAEWLNCTPGVIEDEAKALGLKARRTALNEIDVPELFRLWQTDLTRREIAVKLGVREGNLSRIAMRHKLPPRGQREQKTGVAKVDPFLMPADEYERRKAEVRAMSMARKRLERYEPKEI